MIRVGLLGFWHVHAPDYARQVNEHPEMRLVAAWDDDEDRGRAGAAMLGVPFIKRLDELLERADIDGVIVTTSTASHPAVIIAAAEAGKHIFAEKLLALTSSGCKAILAAVERRGIVLTVSMPELAEGYARTIVGLVSSGVLGTVTEVRVRIAHDGAIGGGLPDRFFDTSEAGGGALVDLGAHPMYLARAFVGRMPDGVEAVYGYVTGRPVDDNAVAVLHWSGGAIGIVETAFVNRTSPVTVEIHGTDRSLVYGVPDGQLFIRHRLTPETGRWEAVPLEPSGPSPLEMWARGIANRRVDRDNLALATDLTTLIEAADQAARRGRSVPLESRTPTVTDLTPEPGVEP